jgi:hypothetical protein
VIRVEPQAFSDWLAGLLEVNGRLYRRDDPGLGQLNPQDALEDVDLYVLSGHLEALRSETIDGRNLEVAADLELLCSSEEEAWSGILAFYCERGALWIAVGEDEYLISPELARRLRLPGL